MKELFDLVRNNYSRPGFLKALYPLNNFEIEKYYQNQPELNGVYSRNNWPKIENEACVINPDEYESIGIHWI